MANIANPIAPTGAAPGVQAVVITKEQKEAGLSPEAAAAQLAAQAQQGAAQPGGADSNFNAIGSRGITVRTVRTSLPAEPAPPANAAPALQAHIIEPPVTPLQLQQPAQQASGQLLPIEGAGGLEHELEQLDDGDRAELAAMLMQRRQAREQQERERAAVEAREQHEIHRHVQAFQPAGGAPTVTVQRMSVQVAANARGAARALQGSQPLVIELRGPIEVHVTGDDPHVEGDGQEGKEGIEAQTSTPKRDGTKPQDEEPGIDPSKIKDEAERQERQAGDHADDIPDDGRPISVGNQGGSEKAPR